MRYILHFIQNCIILVYFKKTAQVFLRQAPIIRVFQTYVLIIRSNESS